jgi:hypothetical protein
MSAMRARISLFPKLPTTVYSEMSSLFLHFLTNSPDRHVCTFVKALSLLLNFSPIATVFAIKTAIKGTVTRDFRFQVFLMNQFPPSS